MQHNPTALWAAENWSDLRRYCHHEIRTYFPQSITSGDVEDLFQEWVVSFISEGTLDERLAKGETISLRTVARFCLRRTYNQARKWGKDAHMRTRGFLTETDRKHGHVITSSDCYQIAVDEADGEVLYIDPEDLSLRMEARQELESMITKVRLRYSDAPQILRCFQHLANGESGREFSRKEGKGSHTALKGLRNFIREESASIG